MTVFLYDLHTVYAWFMHGCNNILLHVPSSNGRCPQQILQRCLTAATDILWMLQTQPGLKQMQYA